VQSLSMLRLLGEALAAYCLQALIVEWGVRHILRHS
jgi:hypothetical protein